jgi:hypothetical protein
MLTDSLVNKYLPLATESLLKIGNPRGKRELVSRRIKI